MTLHLLDFNNGVTNRGTPALQRLCGGGQVWGVRHRTELPPDDGTWILTGGPGSPLEEGPWRTPVLEALRRRAGRGAPTFAICYGFELLSLAFGADVRPLPARRLGVYPLLLTEAGRADPLVAPFHGAPTWENRSWGVFDGAGAGLADGADGDRLIIRFGEANWGVMFHPEAGEDGVRAARADLGIEVDPTGLDHVHLGLVPTFMAGFSR